jgi:23S rRNA pseudouridine2605 synthase
LDTDEARTIPSSDAFPFTGLNRRAKVQAVFAPRRIDKYLRDGTNHSVAAIRTMCEAGRVRLATATGTAKVATTEDLVFEGDAVLLDGALVVPRPEHIYLLFNKPTKVTTTVRDPEGKVDLSRWLRQMPPGVFPIGRLDRDTSGALLLSNDGDFANLVLCPTFHTEKLYWLWLDQVLSDDDPRLDALVKGIPLPGTETALSATRVEIHHRTADYTELHVTLKEGKNRQIRKMCNLLGLSLRGLHRKSIGPVDIAGLAEGQWRRLDTAEMSRIWRHLGGQERIEGARVEALERLAARFRAEDRPHHRLETWLGARARNPGGVSPHCREANCPDIR